MWRKLRDGWWLPVITIVFCANAILMRDNQVLHMFWLRLWLVFNVLGWIVVFATYTSHRPLTLRQIPLSLVLLLLSTGATVSVTLCLPSIDLLMFPKIGALAYVTAALIVLGWIALVDK